MSLNEENDISRVARSVLLKLWQEKKEKGTASLTGFYPVPLEEIINLLGWRLDVVADLGHTDSHPVHGACDHEKNEIRIAADAAANPGQRNFTLAHEIGHAVLHPQGRCDGLPDERVLSRRSSQQVRRMGKDTFSRRNGRENEADAFAKELLMPRKAVKESFKRVFGFESLPLWSFKVGQIVSKERTKVGDISQLRAATRALAKYSSGDTKPLNEFFGVSVEAMAKRLEELSLLY